MSQWVQGIQTYCHPKVFIQCTDSQVGKDIFNLFPSKKHKVASIWINTAISVTWGFCGQVRKQRLPNWINFDTDRSHIHFTFIFWVYLPWDIHVTVMCWVDARSDVFPIVEASLYTGSPSPVGCRVDSLRTGIQQSTNITVNYYTYGLYCSV